MFELREKFEKSNFLAILTPDKRNLVGPRRPSGQFSEIRVPTQWNPNFGIVVHCILGEPSNRIFGKIWEFGPTEGGGVCGSQIFIQFFQNKLYYVKWPEM